MFLMLSCNKDKLKLDVEMYQTQGIPDINQAFACMYFKNEKEGYLFGTYTRYEQTDNEKLDDPNFNLSLNLDITDEANIYKTADGGYSWTKIDSILNYNYGDMVTQDSNSIFIVRDNSLVNFSAKIIKFDLLSNKITGISKDTKTISCLWHDSNVLNYTSNRGDIKLFSLNNNLRYVDSVKITNYMIKGVFSGSNSYVILADEGGYYFALVNKKEIKEIPLIIKPDELIKLNEKELIIGGKMKNDSMSTGLVIYDVGTGRANLLKEFKGYSIIEGLKLNKKVIAGFIGNIELLFTKYDLVYSVDKGESWHIQKLKEPNYIRPSCLVDNIMYIYSGGARMQKIVFK